MGTTLESSIYHQTELMVRYISMLDFRTPIHYIYSSPYTNYSGRAKNSKTKWHVIGTQRKYSFGVDERICFSKDKSGIPSERRLPKGI